MTTSSTREAFQKGRYRQVVALRSDDRTLYTLNLEKSPKICYNKRKDTKNKYKKLMKKLFAKVLAIVTALNMLATNVPLSFAEGANLRVMDTTAGTPAMIMLNGEPNEVVSVTISNPYQSTITQNFQLNEQGVLQHWYGQAVVAGDYQVFAKDEQVTFSVLPGLPDPQRSRLELSDYTAYVGKAIQGSLSLKDFYGNIISGRQIALEQEGNAQINCLNACRSDLKGLVQFSIVSQKAGLKELRVVDADKNLKIYEEDLGFIPQVQAPVANYNTQFNQFPSQYGAYGPYMNPYGNQYLSTQDSIALPALPSPSSSFNYNPYFDPTRASADAQGNNDQGLNTSWNGGVSPFLGANLFQGDLLAQIDDVTSGTLAPSAAQVDHLEVIFSNDPEDEFKEQVTVAAQTALDLIVRAVDATGNTIEDYTGNIEFEISGGGLVPNDYLFSEVDKGEALFELALVLPSGDFTLTVRDKDISNVDSEVEITAQFQGIPNLNNTNIQLSIDSPVANAVYAKDFSVQGSTNTDNTDIIIKEGPLELARGSVDEENKFAFILDLSDGIHSLEISALYLPDGSETSTTVPLEVDKTAPVITAVNLPTEAVKTGESYEITALAEERVKLEVFINNLSYEFDSKTKGEYVLNTLAPLDEGDYPVHVRATDELGNITDSPNVGVLKVIPGSKELSNLFGIPGIGTVTLSWAAVEGAASYEVTYKSIVGSSQKVLTTTEPRITVQDLAANLSYIFTVTAKDAAGADASQATDSKAIKVLEAPVASAPVVNTPNTPALPTIDAPKAAADTETLPVRHTKSGPEVYLLIIASLIVLNLYGRARRRLVMD
jgi:hypothetical protein